MVPLGDEPIPLPDGRKLVTLLDAGEYFSALPKMEHQGPEWQAAMETLIMVAEAAARRNPLVDNRRLDPGPFRECFAQGGKRFRSPRRYPEAAGGTTKAAAGGYCCGPARVKNSGWKGLSKIMEPPPVNDRTAAFPPSNMIYFKTGSRLNVHQGVGGPAWAGLRWQALNHKHKAAYVPHGPVPPANLRH
ncbi:hypothetical protein [Bradyrhizobium sp. URHA0013]|uniref:hypothetical protein n=1 Tax=Bradyrhizobium sp. URHA0013 TaxID=1380352 RepID=UPI0018CC7B5A|nr:hypothetical protein [Bradyrhizobium sp. URHA0013]